MNDFGRQSEPFLFILDFELDKPVLLPIKEVNPEEIRFDIHGFSNLTANTSYPFHKLTSKNFQSPLISTAVHLMK